MKKLFTRLITLSLCAAALSGCSLLDLGGEVNKEVAGLDLRDYKTAAIVNSEYVFDGSVFLKYVDETEKEVTNECTYSTVDTSSIGSSKLKVSYETATKIYSKTVYIDIIDTVKLSKIEAVDYSDTVKVGHGYVFDGKVIAHYNDGTEKDVTDEAIFSQIDTDHRGYQELVIAYTDDEITKKTKVTLQIEAELSTISLSGYTANFYVGDEYAYDGKIYAKYSDNEVKDITDLATIDTSEVNMNEEGDYEVRVIYVENNVTIESSITIHVSVFVPKLTKIAASDYTKTVDKNATYTFDGIVTATYENGTSADVTAACNFSNLSTLTSGNKNMTISYTDTYHNITKTTSISVEVIAKVTGIEAPASIELGVGNSKSIVAEVIPSDAKNKGLSFESLNEDIATVTSAGLLRGIKVGTASILIKSDENPNITFTTLVTVSEAVLDEWTILLYMCGADLESGSYHFATSDLTEILSVGGQPDDVNIVIQTGGASSWSTKYGISGSYNQRYHVENKALVKDVDKVYDSYKSMGQSSTLQDFLEWGLQSYPAEKTGVIFWNHGGAMTGVCFDEKKNDDSLNSVEIANAVKNALINTEQAGSKLEWIGYDACLMQVQDIALTNAPYFNYMLGSEESEAGDGWDYDTWIDDLYAKKSTETILKAAVDGFIKDNGGTSSSSNDQTLSYLDLNYAEEYETAWENMAIALKTKVKSSNKDAFNTLIESAKTYADDGYTNFYYGIIDAKDFVNKLAANSTFNPGSSYTSAVLTAHSHFVGYSSCGKGAGNSFGLCMYWGQNGSTSDYTSEFTTLSNWLYLVNNYGYNVQGGGGWWW